MTERPGHLENDRAIQVGCGGLQLPHGIAVGYVALGPWLSGLVRISADHGLAALEDPTYRKLLWFIAYQASTLIAALVLTVFRPWRKRTAPAGQVVDSGAGQRSQGRQMEADKSR